MLMLSALVRSSQWQQVERMLKKEGFSSATRIGGNGNQDLVWMVVVDEDANRAVKAIREGAYTGKVGDGQIFISKILETFPIETKN